ncbi:MAG: NADH-quinone oxidoreductase subunit N [Archaeoglobaceae archaeon]|nr:NADH-quinone oxidoreductase subunit N [Archaeoglobaceae archaeon]
MELSILIALVILSLGAASVFKDTRLVLATSLIALAVAFSATWNAYTFFIATIAALNIASLEIMKRSQIKGLDYALVALMAIATIYVFFVNDFAMLLAMFVVVSVPTYLLVMVGDGKSNVDVGIKYVTFMVLATILFIIGAVLLVNSPYSSLMYVIGYTTLILGLCIEIGVAPMHEWVPDVFTAADPIPISIIASLAKFVPIVIAYKILVSTANPLTPFVTMILAILAAISMFIGNIGALTSKETSRILAYSTVANMGYILATLTVVINFNWIYLALTGAMLQLIVNSAGKIGFFTAIKEGKGSTPLMYTLALSFIGLPPLMGFWSKLFILTSLVYVGYVWLAIVLVINSAISVPYYIRIARNLSKGWVLSFANAIALITVLIVLITIVPPDWFVEAMKEFSKILFISGV